MNLIESYASSSGLQIGKPFIYEQYFPIPWDKFVILHAGGGMGSKRYDYYCDVVDLLLPILTKYGYKFVQIGGKDDPKINKLVNFCGATNIHQTAYLIRNCNLFIGNDSCNSHIASGFDVPLITLFGPTTRANHGPYFSSPANSIALESHRNGLKPSYLKEEEPKTINLIKPEEIVLAAIKLLGLKEEVSHESIYFGDKYIYGCLDIVPDCDSAISALPNVIPDIRMDYVFDEKFLEIFLSRRPCNIITDKPIDAGLINKYKQSIRSISYEIKGEADIGFIQAIRKSGAKYILHSNLDGMKLADLKLQLLDYGRVFSFPKIGKEVLNKLDPNQSYKYRTNKFLLSNKKIFLNKIRWEQNKSVESFNENRDELELTENFLDQAEFFNIYKHGKQ